MKRSIALSFDKAGKATLVAGPNIPFSEQREMIAKLRHDPTGPPRLEIWTERAGRVYKFDRALYEAQAAHTAKARDAIKAMQIPAEPVKPKAPEEHEKPEAEPGKKKR